MGLMNAWRNWSERQWNRWGKKLQPAYDNINKWETPPWVKKAFAKIWDELDDELKQKLYKLVMEVCKDYDDEFAKKLLKKIIDAVKEYLHIK